MSTHTARYTKPAIWLHWIIAVLMLFMLFQQSFSDNFIRVPVGTSLSGWRPSAHASIGILILLLGMARLSWRLGNPPPALPTSVPRWQIAASHVTHWTFYALMIAIPVTGLLALAPYGADRLNAREVSFIGLFSASFMPNLGTWTGAVHELLTTIAKLLVVIHVLAALKHQFWDKDGIFGRMRPM